ncbi:MAG: hypothetical protein KQI62_05105 [Deltaproteobacteria bacterium]|nr:hypothetical protein [Deltaproteobacteria bacterium]
MRTSSVAGLGLPLLFFILLATIYGCAGGPSAAEYYRDESTMALDTFPMAAVTYGTGLSQWSYTSSAGGGSSSGGSSDSSSGSSGGDVSSGNIKVRLRIDTDRTFSFEMKLKNETNGPITIDWANTYYVNTQGYKYHVAHQGVPLWSPMSKLTPTRVGPGQTIEDDLQPARELKRDGQWLLAPLTDPQIAQGDYPNQLTVLMPIVSNGVEKVHRFSMDIDYLDPMDDWGPWFY